MLNEVQKHGIHIALEIQIMIFTTGANGGLVIRLLR